MNDMRTVILRYVRPSSHRMSCSPRRKSERHRGSRCVSMSRDGNMTAVARVRAPRRGERSRRRSATIEQRPFGPISIPREQTNHWAPGVLLRVPEDSGREVRIVTSRGEGDSRAWAGTRSRTRRPCRSEAKPMRRRRRSSWCSQVATGQVRSGPTVRPSETTS